MQTQQQVADIIFNFLNNLIYEPEKAVIRQKDLPKEFADVVKGLKLFGKWVKETRNFAIDIGNGNIDVQPPGSDNVLAQPIKLLQSNMAHLTWQAKEIAKGDYQQRVDYMGEFSESFNVMITQLQDRRNKLIDNIQTIEQQNQSLMVIRDFFFNFSDCLLRAFFVYDEDYNLVFCNTVGRKILNAEPKTYELIVEKLQEMDHLHFMEVFGGTVENPRWYEIERIDIEWQGAKEISCLIQEVTERKLIELARDKMAFEDPLTGLYNRRYGLEKLQKMIDNKDDFCLAFVDLDNLKYINATFGHSAGDNSIKSIVHSFENFKWNAVVARVGGDEFMLLVKNIKKADVEKELERIRAEIEEVVIRDKKYKNTFSYGVVENHKGWDSASLLRKADKTMYEYKFAHKVKTRMS